MRHAPQLPKGGRKLMIGHCTGVKAQIIEMVRNLALFLPLPLCQTCGDWPGARAACSTHCLCLFFCWAALFWILILACYISCKYLLPVCALHLFFMVYFDEQSLFFKAFYFEMIIDLQEVGKKGKPRVPFTVSCNSNILHLT